MTFYYLPFTRMNLIFSFVFRLFSVHGHITIYFKGGGTDYREFFCPLFFLSLFSHKLLSVISKQLGFISIVSYISLNTTVKGWIWIIGFKLGVWGGGSFTSVIKERVAKSNSACNTAVFSIETLPYHNVGFTRVKWYCKFDILRE